MKYSKVAFELELSPDDVFSALEDKVGIDGILGHCKLSDVCEYIGIKDFIGYFSADEILAHMSDGEIEEEYLKRSPLGRALE